MTEHAYYNAINVHSGGDYGKITKLKKKYTTWQKAWEQESSLHSVDPQKEYKTLETEGISLLLATDSQFPPLLQEIPHPPHALYIKGNIHALKNNKKTKMVAIVGTRRATPTAKITAHEFAHVLGENGVTVVSGLAFGVDVAAHEGVLTGGGTTIAVVATGVNTIYPRAHTHIAQKIIDTGGAIVSEYHAHSPAYPARFLERNRIISGLCETIVVVEAPLASGSLATARFAVEQNRDVLVIPGPAGNPNYAGSHELIRSGATLTATIEHLRNDLGIAHASETESKNPRYATLEESLLLETLNIAQTPLSLDKICEITKLSIQAATVATTNLLLSHAIKETDIGFISINARHR